MKLGRVTKLARKKKNVKKIDNDFMRANCAAIVIFPIYGQFRTLWNPDFGRAVYETYIFINSKPLSYKNRKKNYKIFNTALTILL